MAAVYLVLLAKCDQSRFLLSCAPGSKSQTLRARATVTRSVSGTGKLASLVGATDDEVKRLHLPLLVDKKVATDQTSQLLLLFLLVS